MTAVSDGSPFFHLETFLTDSIESNGYAEDKMTLHDGSQFGWQAFFPFSPILIFHCTLFQSFFSR